MSEEEIYKMLLVEKLDKFPLLNELFAIRDSRGKRNDYTIFVNGYISLDVINKAVEKVNLMENLKEIEQLHQEENGKLRVELEQEKEKNKELQKQLNGAFDRGFISKDKIKKIVNECLEKKPNVITGKEEYCFNVNDNSFLAHRIVELLEGK